MSEVNKVEPIWTYQAKLQRLEEKLDTFKNELLDKIKESQSSSLNAISFIKANLYKDVEDCVDKVSQSQLTIEKNAQEFSTLVQTKYTNMVKEIDDYNINMNNSIVRNLKSAERNLKELFDIHKNECNDKTTLALNSLEALNKKIDTIQFDVIDNENNVAITYINPLGKTEYVAFKKSLPDENTIVWDKNKKLTLKNSFDQNDFKISNNIITNRGLTLSSGKHLTADKINNDLNNATYNISTLTKKVEELSDILKDVNGYITSNNFNTPFPEQIELTKFALQCLGFTNVQEDIAAKLCQEKIPHGTKIKNIHNNHIWVYNKIIESDGLRNFKWEDFGIDELHIADNEGNCGLIVGSKDKLKAFINTDGTISLNGLEEELDELTQFLNEIRVKFDSYVVETDAKFIALNERIDNLESGNK